MDAVTNVDSLKTPVVSPSIPSDTDFSLVESDKQPKRPLRVNKFVAVMIVFIMMVVLAVGYLAFINPFPIYVISMRIMGMKIGYKFYDDSRNLVYFLYPKEGKVVQEANGTVILKNADESGDNAVAIMQPAKDPMPENGCNALDKNIWECQDPLANSDAIYGSYYITQSNIVYLVNFGIRQSNKFKLARIGDDTFFSRILQSLLISPNQSPVTGNVEFLRHKTTLPSGWSARAFLEMFDDSYSDYTTSVNLEKGEYLISLSLLGGGRGYCSTDTPTDSGVIHDKELVLSENIFRLDIVNTTNKQKYLRTKDYELKDFDFPKYVIDLCQNNIQGGDSHESGTRVGLINYFLPENFDPIMLDEMDGIIKDLAKNREEPKQESDVKNVGEACEKIQTISSETYELCGDGRTYQLKRLNKSILNHLSKNYSGSLDKTKLVVWRYDNQFYNDCVLTQGGCGGAVMHVAYMVDMATGNVYKLIESQDRPLFGDDLKLADSVWSPDNKGLLLVNFDGIYYCSTACEFIVTNYCVAGCSSAYFKNGRIEYADSYTDGGELATKPILKTIDLSTTQKILDSKELPGVPLYPNSKFVEIKMLSNCDVAIQEMMDKGYGYNKEAAERQVGGHCDGTEYSFTYNGNMDDVIIWYEKDVSQSGYKLSGGAGAEGVNRFGQLSNGSLRYELSIQNGEYQIVKKDRNY